MYVVYVVEVGFVRGSEGVAGVTAVEVDCSCYYECDTEICVSLCTS